ncbi:MAG TPA: FGGY-family carbohydrate kinase, partial [Ilumatobacteraceae bacterium]|nr:FGGY-family carbohydrate kinase [Ilumatobacteraceae bacterium]
PSKLARLVPMGRPRGVVTAAAAEHLGVSAQAVVADATIDSMTSAVGTGAIDQTRCGLVIGTTAVLATHLPDRRADVEHGLMAAPSPIPGHYVVVAENGIGGKALETFVHGVVYADDGLTGASPSDAYERVLAAAAGVPAGANGVVYLPWLVGSMAPSYHSRVRGGFLGLDLDTTRADMARAVLEGVAANAAWLLPAVATLAGTSSPDIGFGGGVAVSPLWAQILADTMQLPIRRMANPRATNAHGAALLALVHAGELALTDLPTVIAGYTHEPDPALADWAVAQVARLAAAHTHLATLATTHPT